MANLRLKSKESGVAMNTEAYVPTAIPTNRAKTKPLMDEPPKMKMASNTTKVDNEVLNVRRNVEFNAEFVVSIISRFG